MAPPGLGGTRSFLLACSDQIWGPFEAGTESDFDAKVRREWYYRVDHQGAKIEGPVLKVDQRHPNFSFWGE